MDGRRRPLGLGCAPELFWRIVSARHASHWRRGGTKFARSEIYTSRVAASWARQCVRRHALNTADEKWGIDRPCRTRIRPIRADVAASDSDIRSGSSGEGRCRIRRYAIGVRRAIGENPELRQPMRASSSNGNYQDSEERVRSRRPRRRKGRRPSSRRRTRTGSMSHHVAWPGLPVGACDAQTGRAAWCAALIVSL